MEIVIGWMVLSLVAGIIASSKNRSGFGYCFLSLILSPVVGLLLAIGLPKIVELDPVAYSRCPDCKERVIKGARKCKHCGLELLPEDTAPKCPSCGEPALPGKVPKFCISCGHNMS